MRFVLIVKEERVSPVAALRRMLDVGSIGNRLATRSGG